MPTLVGCIHCGETYDNARIEWRIKTSPDGETRGFWCCPIEGCDGKGFGFDVWPVDRDWVDPDGREMGWIDDPPPDPDTDPDKPAATPTPVRCEYCGQTCSSDEMVWWVDDEAPPDAHVMSGWFCPTEGCWGMGFGADLRPTDTDYRDETGRRTLRPGEKLSSPPPLFPDEGEDDIPF